ncbi:hypothetical protein BDZ85DRAFT_126800 [Elsinoe ampelina]|uniref:Uncharacterized protein n=1 Tax=Elsinoe ampelina TaxID=302913 RepID=A0A6A6G9U7_9PEZI|nr:hypothetical protein BDZ85DRAFT_126800 [Elsinoe ampelina]
MISLSLFTTRSQLPILLDIELSTMTTFLLKAFVTSTALGHGIVFQCEGHGFCQSLTSAPLHNLRCQQDTSWMTCSNIPRPSCSPGFNSIITVDGTTSGQTININGLNKVNIDGAQDHPLSFGIWSFSSQPSFLGILEDQESMKRDPLPLTAFIQHYPAVALRLASPMWNIPDQTTTIFNSLVDLAHPMVNSVAFIAAASSINDLFDLTSPARHPVGEQLIHRIAVHDYHAAHTLAADFIIRQTMDHALNHRIRKSVAMEDLPTLILLTHIYASIAVEQIVKVLKQYRKDRSRKTEAVSIHPGTNHALTTPATLPWIRGRDKVAMPPPPDPKCDYVRTAVSVAETLIKASKTYKQIQRCE